MGFLDDIKSRLGMAQPAAEPYGDEPYDDYYDEGVDGGYEDYPEGWCRRWYPDGPAAPAERR